MTPLARVYGESIRREYSARVYNEIRRVKVFYQKSMSNQVSRLFGFTVRRVRFGWACWNALTHTGESKNRRILQIELAFSSERSSLELCLDSVSTLFFFSVQTGDIVNNHRAVKCAARCEVGTVEKNWIFGRMVRCSRLFTFGSAECTLEKTLAGTARPAFDKFVTVTAQL